MGNSTNSMQRKCKRFQVLDGEPGKAEVISAGLFGVWGDVTWSVWCLRWCHLVCLVALLDETTLTELHYPLCCGQRIYLPVHRENYKPLCILTPFKLQIPAPPDPIYSATRLSACLSEEILSFQDRNVNLWAVQVCKTSRTHLSHSQTRQSWGEIGRA